MKSIGIDLAGSSRRPTGLSVVDGRLGARCRTVYSDAEILDAVRGERPEIIAVDAPLSIPRGRVDINRKSSFHLRCCDRELLKRKIKFFPITLGPMRMLTARGMELKRVLERERFRVVEVYPGASQDILGIPRQKRPEELLEGLRSLGIKNLCAGLSVHELDAATCAYTGLLLLEGRAEAIGDGDEGLIILPQLPRRG